MSSAHAAELSSLLAHHGFTRHSLVRNKTGHLQTAGSLNGQPIAMLVDTGASTTVMDLGYCRNRGIPLNNTARMGGGAGGMSLALYTLDGATLEIDGHPIPSADIYVMDMSHVNQGLTAKGADPIQAVIGADILRRHHAVIDYAELALFLKLPA